VPLILSDNHIHPFEKAKSKEGMRRFAERAVEIGLAEITFTEHAPSIFGSSVTGMTEAELESYVAYTIELQSEISNIKIKLGIEADWHIDNQDYLKQLLVTYNFDYVLGSVHIHATPYMNTLADMNMVGIGTLALQQNIAAVESGIFDTIAHLDVFRWLSDKERFGQWPGDYCPEDYHNLFHQLFSSMERLGIALEVNASGIYKKFKSVLPCPEVLEIAAYYNLNYIYGSDAHDWEFLGTGQQEVLECLNKKQFNSLYQGAIS